MQSRSLSATAAEPAGYDLLVPTGNAKRSNQGRTYPFLHSHVPCPALRDHEGKEEEEESHREKRQSKNRDMAGYRMERESSSALGAVMLFFVTMRNAHGHGQSGGAVVFIRHYTESR